MYVVVSYVGVVLLILVVPPHSPQVKRRSLSEAQSETIPAYSRCGGKCSE